jgi:hypothetical protein
MDIKTLKNQKQPSSAKQMACLVAYYLAELAPERERKQTVSVADLEKYFKQAGFPLNQKMEQLLVDGKRSGYFDSQARGAYSLTRVGHKLGWRPRAWCRRRGWGVARRAAVGRPESDAP